MLVSLHPDYVMTHRIEPVAPAARPSSASGCSRRRPWPPGFDPSFAVDFWDLTNRQDWAACEAVQRGLSSRGFRQGPFSTEEDAVAQFVRLVACAYLAGGWTPLTAVDGFSRCCTFVLTDASVRRSRSTADRYSQYEER